MPVVDSIERDTTAFAGGDSSKTVNLGTTLSDVARAELNFTVKSDDANDSRINKQFFRGRIVSTTQIEFIHDTAGKVATIEWEVIQYATGEAVVRASTLTVTADPTNETISSVTAGRSIAKVSVYTDFVGGMAPQMFAHVNLTSDTNLQFDFSTAPSGNEYRCAYQVIEFASGDATVESLSKTLAALTDSDTQAISDVGDLTAALLSFSYSTPGTGSSESRQQVRGRLTSTTVATFDRHDGGSGTECTIRLRVVKFLDGTVVRTTDVALADADATDDDTITAVTLARATVFNDWLFHHVKGGSTSMGPAAMCCTVKLTATTTLTTTRNVTTGAIDLWPQVLDFPAAGGGGTTPKGWFGLPLRGPMRRAVA